jgi:citrate lyase subunit beta/citryl-CoA lyase
MMKDEVSQMDLWNRTRRARSLLFVPGDRPDRFDKAAGAGADLVIIDLEDGVSPPAKAQARENAVAWIGAGNECAVRISAPGTQAHRDDLAALSNVICAVVIAKADDRGGVEDTARALGDGVPLIPMIETAAGLSRVDELAASPTVARLALGNFDLAVELGIAIDEPTAMIGVRHAMVLASAVAGIAPPVDGVTGSLHDHEQVARDVALAVAHGFGAKLCVHPAQIAPAHEALRPSEADVAWAREVLAAAGGQDLFVAAGQMVDKPVVERARRVLVRIGED